ncbi:MAG: hypothetical protein AAGN35_18145 [Bacteroidota bacterium]
MDILNSVIELMTKEELRNFKLYAARSHAKGERKDLALFDYIRRSGERFDEYKILKQLYGGSSKKNTYYRLRNRLLTEVGKSVALLHWDREETALALHYLSLSILYREKQHPRIAVYYLRKAELKVGNLDRLELLDMIYSEFITLSFEVTDINPEDYIEKRRQNREKLNQLRRIDNILAAVNYRLRRSQNLSHNNAAVHELLRKTLAEFAQDETIMSDPKFRFRMYDAVSKILLQKRDYEALEDYLLGTYASFVEEGLFHKGNHDTRLQMLTYIINSLFKNGKHTASLDFAAQLWEAMQDYNRLHYDRYLFFYYNALVLNYSASDIDKAIATLEEMSDNELIGRTPHYLLYINLNLALSEYVRGKYKPSLRHLVRLRLLDVYSSADPEFHFRVDIFELALRLESGDFETLEYRLGQFNNDYRDLLPDSNYRKDAALVRLIERLNETLDVRKDPVLVQDIQDFLDDYVPDDTEIFKYGDFLRAKIK